MTDETASTKTMLVKGLAAASLSLGLSEVISPAKVAELAGIDETDRSRTVIRALGLRECAHGAGLLFGPNKLVSTRVAGDLLDVSLLGVALANSKSRPAPPSRNGVNVRSRHNWCGRPVCGATHQPQRRPTRQRPAASQTLTPLQTQT